MSLSYNATLPAFDNQQQSSAKIHLATKVAHMMGRKLEEGDWGAVYCAAKGIPDGGWSNLNIDVNHQGLGVEHKLLRCSSLNGKPIKSVCGTTMMHPAATRSVRIENTRVPANDVMLDVFRQYAALIADRAKSVKAVCPNAEPDLRIGWLLWEDLLTEFLYFEQRLESPSSAQYYAQWNETPAKGARKSSKSLWIFDKETHKKRYSVTTSAGIKIQPYFDVPSPADPNLYYFRVQSEFIDDDTVKIWVAASTARAIRRVLGGLEKDRVSLAVIEAARVVASMSPPASLGQDMAQPILLSKEAFDIFQSTWEGVSDEHRAQLFLETLHVGK